MRDKDRWLANVIIMDDSIPGNTIPLRIDYQSIAALGLELKKRLIFGVQQKRSQMLSEIKKIAVFMPRDELERGIHFMLIKLNLTTVTYDDLRQTVIGYFKWQ